MLEPNRIYTLSETATLLQVTAETVRGYIAAGYLVASILPGGRIFRIRGEDISEFLRRNETAHGKPEA